MRYTTATGYKLRGTVGPQGELELQVVAPPNSSNAGSAPIDLVTTGTIDDSGTVRVRQSSHSCSYDGYAYEYNPLFDPEWPKREAPHETGRARFGPIAIANSDSAAAAYTDAAIDQAYRAVLELIEG